MSCWVGDTLWTLWNSVSDSFCIIWTLVIIQQKFYMNFVLSWCWEPLCCSEKLKWSVCSRAAGRQRVTRTKKILGSNCAASCSRCSSALHSPPQDKSCEWAGRRWKLTAVTQNQDEHWGWGQGLKRVVRGGEVGPAGGAAGCWVTALSWVWLVYLFTADRHLLIYHCWSQQQLHKTTAFHYLQTEKNYKGININLIIN